MMTGVVNARLEATLLVSVEDSAGHLNDTEAVIDTGFTGDLTLPPAVIARLGLIWQSHGVVILGDGSVRRIDTYRAIIMWDYAPCSIDVDEVDTRRLIGTRLLHGYEVRIKVRDGGNVTIEALP